ncbi:hypothetical protein C8Q79DRAFT_284663 [Trametes meyenii]|nr:hypothetical protein C8Q79DRAFT_284663 [Trametes meyenii]
MHAIVSIEHPITTLRNISAEFPADPGYGVSYLPDRAPPRRGLIALSRYCTARGAGPSDAVSPQSCRAVIIASWPYNHPETQGPLRLSDWRYSTVSDFPLEADTGPVAWAKSGLLFHLAISGSLRISPWLNTIWQQVPDVGERQNVYRVRKARSSSSLMPMRCDVHGMRMRCGLSGGSSPGCLSRAWPRASFTSAVLVSAVIHGHTSEARILPLLHGPALRSDRCLPTTPLFAEDALTSWTLHQPLRFQMYTAAKQLARCDTSGGRPRGFAYGSIALH